MTILRWKKWAKKVIQALLVPFGLKITQSSQGIDGQGNIDWLRQYKIRTVIDIGASKGKATLSFRKMFPDAWIYAFEPLPDCFDQMQKRLKNDPKCLMFNKALSDQEGMMTIHRSSYSGASSLLKMADIQKQLFPVVAGQKEQVVTVARLDKVMAPYQFEKNILIKVDVQGLEDGVIRGGRHIFNQAKVILIETSFVELYEGQPLFADIYDLLTDLGFKYSGVWVPEFKSPRDGRALQQDSIFIKDEQ